MFLSFQNQFTWHVYLWFPYFFTEVSISKNEVTSSSVMSLQLFRHCMEMFSLASGFECALRVSSEPNDVRRRCEWNYFPSQASYCFVTPPWNTKKKSQQIKKTAGYACKLGNVERVSNSSLLVLFEALRPAMRLMNCWRVVKVGEGKKGLKSRCWWEKPLWPFDVYLQGFFALLDLRFYFLFSIPLWKLIATPIAKCWFPFPP